MGPEDDVDLHRFRALVHLARAGERDERAVELLAEALRLWRGAPLAELDTPCAEDTRTALLAERLGAELDYNDIQLRLGGHGGLLPNLLSCSAEDPLHERLLGELMLALYRDGEHELPGPVPRRLPAAPRFFAGRGRELAALTRRFEIQREAENSAVMLAINGAGGIGKTWLALRWAHSNLDQFPDGQLYVNLCGGASQALQAFLEALGVENTAIPAELDERAALFRSLIAGRRLLILLDNARDSADLIPLLPGDSACTVLITSRNRLAGLTAGQPLELDLLGERHARELLAEHMGVARLVNEPDAVSELLSYCGGLPLALGLVAARARAHPTVPLAVLAEELRDASARLAALDVDDAELNLRTVLSWSSSQQRPAEDRSDVVRVGLVVVEEDRGAEAVGEGDEGFNGVGVVGLGPGEFRDGFPPASRHGA